jgi:hypothetical protein
MAGMLRIQPNQEELKHQHDWWVTYAFWNMLHDSFGIPCVTLQWINEYLSEHLIEITMDNIMDSVPQGRAAKRLPRQIWKC